jgi:hypothetical protein
LTETGSETCRFKRQKRGAAAIMKRLHRFGAQFNILFWFWRETMVACYFAFGGKGWTRVHFGRYHECGFMLEFQPEST